MGASEFDRSFLSRRSFLRASAATAGALSLGAGGVLPGASLRAEELPGYRGPNVILIRFGGGVRRQETILDRKHCWCPFFRDELLPRGTLYPQMTLDQGAGVDTSHGQGTLHLLTGRYDGYVNEGEGIGEAFVPQIPTLFEYLRATYDIPEHQALIVNGEDRKQEEFFTFSQDHRFGIEYRSRTVSLHRFKLHILKQQLAAGRFEGEQLAEKQKLLREMTSIDYRQKGNDQPNPELEAFWDRWRDSYGESGFKNPRGDRLLTELTVRAIRELRPRLVMVNYQDPDYVHWGNPNHYFWALQIIDEGMRRLWETVQLDEEYRDNTIFIVVPDCGRDDNPFAPVPYQHHFNTRSAHEIFALLVGPGIAAKQIVDRRVDQCMVAGTLGKLMGFEAREAEGQVLEEAFA